MADAGTPDGQDQPWEKLHAKIGAFFAVALGVLLFCTYPMALIPAGFVSQAHAIVLPARFLLSLLALAVLCSGPRAMKWPLMAAVGAFALSVVVGPNRYRGYGQEIIEILGFATIPYAVAILAQRDSLLNFRRLGKWLLAFWLWQVVLGLWSYGWGIELSGAPGNRNWLGSLLLALSPWAFFELARMFERPHRPALRGRLLALFLVGAPTLFLVFKCQSRGAWLALPIACLPFVFGRLRRLEKALLAVFLVLLCITVGVVALAFAPRQLFRGIGDDIRLPVWGRTIAMIADHPAGVGPGRFRRVFTPYRASSQYHRRAVAATATIHPHNELLNLAAQLGVVGGLAWLVMLAPLALRAPPDDRRCEVARFSALLVICHGMLDMSLVQPPGSFMAMAWLGLCWAPLVRPSRPLASGRVAGRLRATATSIAVLAVLLAGAAVTARQLRLTGRLRLARAAAESGENGVALVHYQQVLRIDPDHLDSLYSAGMLAMLELNEPTKALEYLRRVYEIDPNFAHVHLYLCRAAWMLKRFPQALLFAERECRLYPASPEAHFLLNACLFVNNRFPQMAGVVDHVAMIQADASLRRHGESVTRARAEVEAWLAAIEVHNQSAALELARRICPELAPGVDPLLGLVLHAQNPEGPVPVRRAAESFDEADYAYWQRGRLVAKIRAEFRPLGQPQPDPPVELARVLKRLAQHVRVVADAPEWQDVRAVWRTRRASPLSFYCLLASVLTAMEYQAAIQFDEQDQAAGCVVVAAGATYKLARGSEAVELLRPADPPDGERQPGIEWARLKMFFPARQFLMKNQILAGVGRAMVSRDPLPGWPQYPPSVELPRMMAATGRQDMRCDTLSQYCIGVHLADALPAAETPTPP